MSDTPRRNSLTKLSLLLPFVFISLAWLPAATHAEVPLEIAGAYSSIRGAEIMDFVRVIASDKFKGRGSGSQQGYQTALMLAGAMQESGFSPAAGSETYLQPFSVERNVIEGTVLFEVLKGTEVIYTPKFGEEFVFRGFTGSGDVTAPAVFLGYGLTLPGYDDYSGIDVSGKVTVILNGLPPELDTGENATYKLAGYKMGNAADRGAVAVILIGDVESPPSPPLASVYKGDFPYREHLPAVKVNSQVGHVLGRGLSYPLSSIKRLIDEDTKPMSFPLETTVHIAVKSTYESRATAYNVVGRLTGRHSSLRNRYIVITAHMDHVGYQDGIIFNGADDNASGTAVIHALARALGKLEKRPRRSIILVGFSGEELGLLGSKYFVENPPVPLSRIDALINLDMVGMGTFATVFGGMDFPIIYSAFASHTDDAGIKIVHSNSNPMTDHIPFKEAGVPAVSLIAIGEHVGYHTPNDDADNLSPAILEDVAQVVFLAAWTLAEY